MVPERACSNDRYEYCTAPTTDHATLPRLSGAVLLTTDSSVNHPTTLLDGGNSPKYRRAHHELRKS